LKKVEILSLSQESVVSVHFGSNATRTRICAHWNPYYQLQDVNHALCNAHHLRELKALQEIEQESWAKSMKKLLLLACNYQHRYQSGIP